jgi:hypothetical protein
MRPNEDISHEFAAEMRERANAVEDEHAWERACEDEARTQEATPCPVCGLAP